MTLLSSNKLKSMLVDTDTMFIFYYVFEVLGLYKGTDFIFICISLLKDFSVRLKDWGKGIIFILLLETEVSTLGGDIKESQMRGLTVTFFTALCWMV